MKPSTLRRDDMLRESVVPAAFQEICNHPGCNMPGNFGTGPPAYEKQSHWCNAHKPADFMKEARR